MGPRLVVHDMKEVVPLSRRRLMADNRPLSLKLECLGTRKTSSGYYVHSRRGSFKFSNGNRDLSFG